MGGVLESFASKWNPDVVDRHPGMLCGLRMRVAIKRRLLHFRKRISKGIFVSVKVETLVLFGATGDLAQCMLFPSLYNLPLDGLLADELTIIGSGQIGRASGRERVCQNV